MSLIVKKSKRLEEALNEEDNQEYSSYNVNEPLENTLEYEDDENNFVFNHASKNRNKKYTGVYYGKNIIKKDGSIVPITYKFIKTVPHKHLGKIFNISASNGLKINISVQTNFEDENFDKRSIKTGLECKNYIKTDIREYYKLTDDSKFEYCFNLIGKICEEQLSNNQRFIVTPFERNSIL